jgi:general secretion pathway protein A
MYESHFGFTGSPFQLNPDPAFYFDSKGHSSALAYLKFGAHQGEGFIVVTGEIGAGKTTLVRTLLDGLNPEQVVAAQVVSTQLESSELLQAILMAFGVPCGSTSKAHLIASLEGFLTVLAAKGRRALLIIDEAQNLKHEAVEELRMLSNFQLGKYGLLQSFLVGQPELRSLLQSKSMEQLRQRVIASCHLGPLAQGETRAYVEHRLRRVGWTGHFPAFAPGSLESVHRWTGGVPRKINRLCNRMLLGAFLADARVVSAAMVDETALELGNEIGAAGNGLPTPQSAPPQVPVAEPLTASTPLREEDAKAQHSVMPVSMPGPRIADALADQQASEVAREGVDMLTGQAAQFAANKIDAGATSVRKLVRRIHSTEPLDRPLVCLVDSAADYLKAGVLANAFKGFPSLPRVVAVHTGVEEDLEVEGLDKVGLPLPDVAIHLGVSEPSFASQVARIVKLFDALLTELEPRAVTTMSSSDADFACSLLAHKRGARLLRTGSGRRGGTRAQVSDTNAVLIERICDVLYTDSTEDFYALYREGIRLDRVHSVGSLSREMLDLALSALRDTHTSLEPTPGIDPWVGSQPHGMVAIDPRSEFTASIAQLVELSRELPLLWPMRPSLFSRFGASGLAEQVKGSRIMAMPSKGFLHSLDLLRNSACLVGDSECPWLEEAKLMGVPTRVFVSSPALAGTMVGSPSAAVSQRPDRSKPRYLLGAQTATSQTPEYWDTGTAERIAKHMIGWLAAESSESKAFEGPATVTDPL